MHVKCAIAHSNAVLISSANLIEYALALNIELSLLVRGGVISGQVTRYPERLTEAKVLTRL